MSPLEMIRARLVRILPAVTGLAIIGVVVYQQRGLEQLTESVQRNSTVNQVQSLDERLSVLEQLNSGEKARPQAVTLLQLSELQVALEQRLETQEAKLNNHATTSEMHALRDKVGALASSIHKLEAENPVHLPAKHPSSRSAVKRPPFRINGIEVRGSHRFVAISPLDLTGPDQIQLLRVGDHHLDWRLEEITPQAVVFRVGGQTRRLDLR